MFCRFFIDRPIFAAVLSILITLAGGIAVFQLPVAQYPPVTPPTVQVDCNYPGASAAVVAQTVASPIEQQVNGVENMLYMASQSTSDGSYTLTVTFKPGMDLNLAQVLVQNRLSLALPSLPDVVRQTGVTTRKRSPDILLTVSLNSPDGRYDQLYLSNYAVLHVRDELSRLPGISDIIVFGQRDYSMRIWLDPDKLAARHLAINDVLTAVRSQNTQVALGQIGQPPAVSGQVSQYPITVLGRLEEPEQFENIIVHAAPDGRKVYIRDVGRVELAARSYDVSNRFDQKPTVGLAIFQLPDANALETADMIKAKMKELSADFPEGCEYEVGYDTTPFIRESVEEVFKSLRDAVLLVAVVVLLFLQGWRAAIIPLLAVPVAIVGTFAAMYLVGFSLNNLTLFGLVLAIGIVVDDAIVVVEAVEHHIERGLAPREAAIRAMDEVASPVIAVGCVLSAVFIPCAFISGIVGQFFRQFALTIAISTIISTFNSLTLSPALAALLLRPKGGKRDPLTWLLDVTLGWLFWLFNAGLKKSTVGYTWTVGRMLRVPMMVLVVYGGLLLLTYFGFNSLPTGFIPSQDKGYLVASVQLPDSASAARTRDVIARIESIALETPGVKNVNSVAGNSFLLSAYGSNFGSMFIILKNFSERHHKGMSGDEILATLKSRYATEVPEALVNVFPPPAVSGLGRGGGFKLMVEDRGEAGLEALQKETDNLVKLGNATPGLTGLFTVYKANSPQLFVDVNRDACLTQGVNLNDVFGTLQAYLGSRYVNDFNRFGRTWQVVVQADAKFRDEVEDVKKLMVRNAKGQMVPMGTLASVEPISNPLVLTRYNMYPAAAIQGTVAPGFSSGQANAAFENLAKTELPSSMSFEWTELAFMERNAANTGLIVFAFSVVFVFLVLAALYESWALPLAVILVVPMCVLSSIAGVALAKMDINIFTQIGFVVLIGLACKNAILIVEFAKARVNAGEDIRTATLEACSLRLRPILMTSFAFILGVVPLVVAEGAGAEMRRALGTAVFSGMLGVTLFGIVLTPVFFYVIEHFAEWHWFSHGWLQRLSAQSLAVLRLEPLRRGLKSLSNQVFAPQKAGTSQETRQPAKTNNIDPPAPPAGSPPAQQ
ncbi:Efflux pump membrane transporter BepG [Anatilimnocola aggregata]|uniref:Efflux pump membrane transporter BepG n=1 Tax=Anatilimnocola aggregata TaxID=2528021 RepID=A0A517YHT3_9BACT|nr:multidrug efflux RND transporter permease subunit [Anatilimnocola aggregata]QDU29764.1 Efflux pump membrane transporter BepG [Anatilimnocola aggregata]